MKTIKPIMEILSKHYNKDRTTLNRMRKNPDAFKILISCLLSLRTQDKNTEKASSALFSVADTPKKTLALSKKKLEKLIFCLTVLVLSVLLVPASSPLIFMLMLGNFLRESGVTERLSAAAQNEIINIVTIFLGTSVGITMAGERFLNVETLKIIFLGAVAFGLSTAGGVLMGKLMNYVSPKNPINPLIGAAGVSAMPMSARVAHLEGQREDPNNYLIMHAMGPNVAGGIGTVIVAGYFIASLSK